MAVDENSGCGGPAGLQVLLVEDDFADVALIEDAFATHDPSGRLHHVRDGREAMAFLRREGTHVDAPRPDLVILDLNMPRMNGRKFLAVVKADERFKTIPVVVFTTSTIDADVLASYSAHANAYVTKPADLDAFGLAVAEVLRFYGTVAALPPTVPGDEYRS